MRAGTNYKRYYISHKGSREVYPSKESPYESYNCKVGRNGSPRDFQTPAACLATIVESSPAVLSPGLLPIKILPKVGPCLLLNSCAETE